MELLKIQIKNFRSIKDEEITFSHNCLILLGKNEAGKSNILKAIAAVFGKYSVADQDKRKRIGNEAISDYFIRAIFQLEDPDFREIVSRLSKMYTGFEAVIFKGGKTPLHFVKSVFRQLLMQLDFKNTPEIRISYWAYDKSDFELVTPLFLVGNKISKVDESGATNFDFHAIAFETLRQYFLDQKFNCHYWQYRDDILLPNKVNRREFISNPSSVKGLENLFVLCKRENIAKEFEEAWLQDQDYSNLLEQVSAEVTKIFQKAWDDFKNTAIQLISDGDFILIKVVDKTKYTFGDRSDGFKKYISILLMLSTESRSNRINEKDLILIDEPDQSLYPTSARFLKDELLNIGRKSKLIYSTHSQYMIDSECIERHLIVEKNDDVTTVRSESKKSPFAGDELLRNAIGTSIFEVLKPKNLIFEGYLDKEIFSKYSAAIKKSTAFRDYGIVYLSGISGVEVLVQLLMLARKKFLIVSDSDETSQKKRNDFEKSYPDYKKNWLSYGDICKEVSTMEDFIQSKIIEQELKKMNGEFVYDMSKSAIQNIDVGVDKAKEKKQEVKNRLVKNLKKEHVNELYGSFLDELKVRLDAL